MASGGRQQRINAIHQKGKEYEKKYQQQRYHSPRTEITTTNKLLFTKKQRKKLSLSTNAPRKLWVATLLARRIRGRGSRVRGSRCQSDRRRGAGTAPIRRHERASGADLVAANGGRRLFASSISRVQFFDLTHRIQGCGCIIVIFTSSLARGGGCAGVTILFISIFTSIGHACGTILIRLIRGRVGSVGINILAAQDRPRGSGRDRASGGLQVGFR